MVLYAQLLASFLIDDACFYVYHRALHSRPWLYAAFHKQHHAYIAPFAWSSHAVHPVEMSLQSIGAMIGPLLFRFDRPLFWLWLTLRQWQGVLDHAGYELPCDVLHRIPGVGGTRFHVSPRGLIICIPKYFFHYVFD